MNKQDKLATESIMLDLLDRWEMAWERGESVSPEELCSQHPELVDQLRCKVEALKAINGHLESQTLAPLPKNYKSAKAFPLPPNSNPANTERSNGIQASSVFSDLEFLAQGGLGVVYSATDQSMNREVAIKFVQPRLTPDPISRRQFDLEAQITGRLEHPGVVPMYGVGQTGDGKPFYVMRLIQGETLDSRIEQLHAGGPPGVEKFAGVEFRDLLQHFVSVCQTIAYAHNRGILHRDIKPANVMLGRYGETLVVDWGLAMPVTRDERAKASGEQTLMSTEESNTGNSSGNGAGTLAYMSPEQSTGDVPLTPASDVYSLGATLYKMIAGTPPFSGHNARSVLGNVRRGQFPPPKELNRNVPAPLQAICLKAMAHQPTDRYATALELAADVQRFLADEPVSVQSETLIQRVGRWCRIHRTAALALSTMMLAMLLLVSGAAIGFQRLASSEHQLLLASQAAEGRSLQMAARFAAQTVAAELDIRWRILEMEAADGELRTLLTELMELDAKETNSQRRLLQAWLDGRFLQHQYAVGFTSWFICDREGTQIARSPRADTIGQNYAHRDYFHGNLDSVPQSPQPLRDVHLSQVFVSAAEKTDMIAFSVPIWDASVDAVNRQVIGVLAMTVLAGEFGILESGLQDDQVAMLVDTRVDQIDGSPQTGRILHHPRLSSIETDNPHSRRLALAEVDGLTLFASRNSTGGKGKPTAEQLFQIKDPFADSIDTTMRGAVEPVTIRGRPPSQSNTGWLVVVKSPVKE